MIPRVVTWIFILTLLSSCRITDERDERLRNLAAVVGLVTFNAYDQDECLGYYGPVNILYFGPEYYGTFSKRSGDVHAAVLGDSTMDFSTKINGYLSGNSVSFAVAGNTACDMIVQLRAFNVKPDFVMISTADGNGLAGQKTTLENIIKTNQHLHNKVFEKTGVWPKWVGIHPTKVTYANQNKGRINSETKTYVQANGGCFYDPLPLFGVAEGQPANDSDMIDSIHYTEQMALNIKTAFQTACGVAL